MTKETYKRYLQSPQWNAIRNRKILKANFECEHCGCDKHLHVHHLTYARVGNEKEADLIVLCSRCHETIEAVILHRGHSRKGNVKGLRNFTHRKLRKAGIQMKNGKIRHLPKTITKWAKANAPIIASFRDAKRKH